jgi:peptide/nickel transport system permease protein
MIRLIPGDAVAIMLGANPEVTPERMAALRARVGDMIRAFGRDDGL